MATLPKSALAWSALAGLLATIATSGLTAMAVAEPVIY